MRGRSRSQSLSDETSSCSSAAASDLSHKMSTVAIISDEADSTDTEEAKVNGKKESTTSTASSRESSEDSDPVESDFSEADADEIEEEEVEVTEEEEEEEEVRPVEYTLDDFQIIKTIELPGTELGLIIPFCRENCEFSLLCRLYAVSVSGASTKSLCLHRVMG
ncbi:hypothetical protein DMENIID0001_070960 [Sergentomyia squamirostris]